VEEIVGEVDDDLDEAVGKDSFATGERAGDAAVPERFDGAVERGSGSAFEVSQGFMPSVMSDK
jgi:hypothetical protein